MKSILPYHPLTGPYREIDRIHKAFDLERNGKRCIASIGHIKHPHHFSDCFCAFPTSKATWARECSNNPYCSRSAHYQILSQSSFSWKSCYWLYCVLYLVYIMCIVFTYQFFSYNAYILSVISFHVNHVYANFLFLHHTHFNCTQDLSVY